MNVRLLILIALAAGLAVYFALADRTAELPPVPSEGIVFEDDIQEVRERQLMVWQQDIECREVDPAEAAVSIHIWVDAADGKNRLYFDMTEAHGYYVDTCNLTFWYKDSEETTGPDDSPLVIPVPLNNFVKANDTLRDCIDVVWAELENVGGDLGTAENWDATVEGCYRACLGNPVKLPVVTKVSPCD